MSAIELSSRPRVVAELASLGLPTTRGNKDSARRVLRYSITGPIICSMAEDRNHRDFDRLTSEPEFIGMNNRVVISAEPANLARFTSTNQVASHLRKLMNIAADQR